MRVTLSLLSLLGMLMVTVPAGAQPSGPSIAQSQDGRMVEKVDSRRYDGRRPHHRPHHGDGYHRHYYPAPYYAYTYPYPYPYTYYAPYAPYYGPRGGVSLSFGF